MKTIREYDLDLESTLLSGAISEHLEDYSTFTWVEYRVQEMCCMHKAHMTAAQKAAGLDWLTNMPGDAPF